MLQHHPHRPVPDLRADLLRHDGILPDSERSGIKPVTVQGELLVMVNEVAAPSLLAADGVWVADYVRLRFVAEAG
jgi:hypothetical protein